MDGREKLAGRAAEIFADGGKTYTECVNQAMTELNPTADPGAGEKLLYALLNVSETVERPKRLSPRGKPLEGDVGAYVPGETETPPSPQG